MPRLGAPAQTRQPFSRVAVTVTPDRPGWLYQPGEPVSFRIDVVRDGHPVTGAKVSYGVGPEMLPRSPRRPQSSDRRR